MATPIEEAWIPVDDEPSPAEAQAEPASAEQPEGWSSPAEAAPLRTVVPGARDDTASLAERLVATRDWVEPGRVAWIPLGPGDRPAVSVGDAVSSVTAVAEHLRDGRVLRFQLRAREAAALAPGSTVSPGDLPGRRHRAALTEDAVVLHRTPRGRVSLVVGRLREPVEAHAEGTVTAITPGGIALRLAGGALPGIAGAGRPVHGRLRIAVGDPGDELRSPGLNVADAGSIIVAGARVDVETLTRASALGIHGVITGGIAGQDLRAFSRSEARQLAALHTRLGFAVLVLEGFGRRSLAGPPWELLLAAAGTSVAIFPDPPILAFDPSAPLSRVAPGTVRIAAGPGAGTAGAIAGPAALRRFDDGVHLLAVPFVGGGRRWIVPLADLERYP